MFNTSYGVTGVVSKMATKTLHRKPKPGAQFGFTLFNEAIVEAAFALASADIQSEQQARDLFFSTAGWNSEVEIGPPGSLRSHDAWLLRRSGRAYVTTDWAVGQSFMQEMLPLVRRFGSLSAAKRRHVYSEVNSALVLQQTNRALFLKIGPFGLELMDHRQEYHDSIAAACSRSLIPFLIPEGWSPARIGECQYRNCGAWFLRPAPKRGSVPLYCSPQHASSEHVSRFREQQRKPAAKPK